MTDIPVESIQAAQRLIEAVDDGRDRRAVQALLDVSHEQAALAAIVVARMSVYVAHGIGHDVPGMIDFLEHEISDQLSAEVEREVGDDRRSAIRRFLGFVGRRLRRGPDGE